jgi:hypothetical protein
MDVRTGKILALLVVLALSLLLCTVPAGSATLQRHTANDDQLAGVTIFKGGDDGEGIDSGDDDRWGNARTTGSDPELGTSHGDDGDGISEISSQSIMTSARLISIRFLFGYLVVLL